MNFPDEFTNDLDRIARGETPAPTDDAEDAALLATAQRLGDGLRPLREAPPSVQERLEARLVAQLPAARRRRMPVLHLRPVRRWQTVVGLAAAAALVLAVVGAAFTWYGPSQPVSAQALIDKAQETAALDAAPSGITSYHLTATESTMKVPGGTITQEKWYAGKDRQRSDTQIKDANGTVIATNGTIFTGTEMWNYSTESPKGCGNSCVGQTRVIHTTGAQWTTPVDSDPSQGGSVADVIAKYNQNDKACQTATEQGQATVAGRTVYVLVLTPKQDGCGGKAQNAADEAKIGTAKAMRATAAAGDASNPTAQAKAATARVQYGSSDPGAASKVFGQMTVWVDTQTFLPLKTETKATDGTVLDRYEVTSITYNVTIPDSTFTYSPPANATVYTFNGTSAEDVKATIAANEGKGTPPTKKP